MGTVIVQNLSYNNLIDLLTVESITERSLQLHIGPFDYLVYRPKQP